MNDESVDLYREEARDIPIAHRADVIVVGGGVAGVSAAIASARTGADTLLIERYGALGGNLTIGLLEASMSFHDRQGKQLIGGIPDEIIQRLKAAGGTVGHVVDDVGYAGTVTPYDPEELKMVCLDMTQEAGVRLLLHTWVVRAVRSGDRLTGVLIENKSGRQLVEAKVFVDCSGDADVAALAGVEFVKGREGDGLTQPMSILFKLGNVDVDGVLAYVESHPEDFKTSDRALGRLRTSKSIHLWGFGSILEKGYAEGALPFHRTEMHVQIDPERGEAIINATRFAGDGTKANELTRAEIALRGQVKALVAHMKAACPGFERSYLMTTAMGAQVRETRRIVGEYTLTKEDVVEGTSFADTVVLSGFPADLHNPTGTGMEFHITKTHQIPYRCLVPKIVDGLLVAGRCVSGTREALGAIRQTAPAMAMGQAAGTAAALSIFSQCAPRTLSVELLRNELRKAAVILDV
jgi:FAD dependent oxidoreductase